MSELDETKQEYPHLFDGRAMQIRPPQRYVIRPSRRKGELAAVIFWFLLGLLAGASGMGLVEGWLR